MREGVNVSREKFHEEQLIVVDFTMPCIEDWLSDPLSVIDGFFANSESLSHSQVSEYFANRLQDESNSRRVPSINDTALHNLKPNSLVRFRCMVQDMFDPEYFLATYEVVDTANGSKSLKCGMYRDSGNCPPGTHTNVESASNTTGQRQTFYCVPIPGENDWVKESFAGRSAGSPSQPNSSETNAAKRSLDDDEEMQDVSCSKSAGAQLKRTRDGEASNNISGTAACLDLNFPLPGEKGPACLIKIYSETDKFKVNDVVEFYGVLSVDPSLARFDDQAMEQDTSFLNPTEFLSREEQEVHHPPPSLVPRIHCLLARHMTHNNPTIPAECTADGRKAFFPQVAGIRKELLVALTKLLNGDSVAADFLLLNLVSSVYARTGVLALGKFSLNISGCPSGSDFTQNLYHFLEELVPKSYLLSMSLGNMNSLQFTPKKDYTANRLKSAILQLSAGTHLTVDETAMETGQLKETGVTNVAALSHIISWQKLEYNFDFYSTEFQTDLAILILSEGKSLLPSDCHIVMQSQATAVQAREVITSLSPGMLQQMRAYLGIVRLSRHQYSLSDEMQEVLQSDFVQSRQSDHSTMTPEEFHLLLLLARLMSLSLGQEALTPEVWNQVKAMEAARQIRLQETPSGSS